MNSQQYKAMFVFCMFVAALAAFRGYECTSGAWLISAFVMLLGAKDTSTTK